MRNGDAAGACAAQARVQADIEKLLYVENHWHLIEAGAKARSLDAATARAQIVAGMVKAEAKVARAKVRRRYKRLERERVKLFEFVRKRATRAVEQF